MNDAAEDREYLQYGWGTKPPLKLKLKKKTSTYYI